MEWKNKFKINFIKTLKTIIENKPLKKNCWFQIMKYLHTKLLQICGKNIKKENKTEQKSCFQTPI